MRTFDTKKYATLLVSMTTDFLNGTIEESHFANELHNISNLIKDNVKPYQTNNGDTIQVFVQYGSILLERIGKSFYLNACGATYHLTEPEVKNLLIGLDEHGGKNPLTAANYLISLLNSGYFLKNRISI